MRHFFFRRHVPACVFYRSSQLPIIQQAGPVNESRAHQTEITGVLMTTSLNNFWILRNLKFKSLMLQFMDTAVKNYKFTERNNKNSSEEHKWWLLFCCSLQFVFFFFLTSFGDDRPSHNGSGVNVWSSSLCVFYLVNGVFVCHSYKETPAYRPLKALMLSARHKLLCDSSHHIKHISGFPAHKAEQIISPVPPLQTEHRTAFSSPSATEFGFAS